MFVRLQHITEQLREQLGPDAIDRPDARRRFRKAIKEMSPQLDDFLTRRIMEDEILGKKSSLSDLADELHSRWLTLNRLEMEYTVQQPAAKPTFL